MQVFMNKPIDLLRLLIIWISIDRLCHLLEDNLQNYKYSLLFQNLIYNFSMNKIKKSLINEINLMKMRKKIKFLMMN
jgi:hypothetical protein